MLFEWDENKNKKNHEKHGLAFQDAKFVFDGETISFLDDRNNYGETRYITMGTLNERVVVIAHTERPTAIRIISMRKANEREKKIYYQRLKESR